MQEKLLNEFPEWAGREGIFDRTWIAIIEKVAEL